MHMTFKARARAGITGLTAALAMFGLLSSPLGFHLAPRALAQPLAIEVGNAPYPHQEVDDVLINQPGYKFGGVGYANGSPSEPGAFTFTRAWWGSFGELTGRIHFDGAERCARVQLISYDASGAEMSQRDFSDTECPAHLGHIARDVTEGGSSGVTAQLNAAKVKVTLQTLNTNGTWSNAGSQTVTYGPRLDQDPVEILRARVDLGLGAFDGTKPAAPATLTWNSEGGPVSANLVGTLYVTDSIGLCFRMHAGYKDHEGTLLEDPRHGDEHCVETDGLHTFPVSMGGAFAHNELARVTYAIEQKGGTGVWETIGQMTLDLGDPPVNTSPTPEIPDFP
jgi:hypothetical protein